MGPVRIAPDAGYACCLDPSLEGLGAESPGRKRGVWVAAAP